MAELREGPDLSRWVEREKNEAGGKKRKMKRRRRIAAALVGKIAEDLEVAWVQRLALVGFAALDGFAQHPFNLLVDFVIEVCRDADAGFLGFFAYHGLDYQCHSDHLVKSTESGLIKLFRPVWSPQGL